MLNSFRRKSINALCVEKVNILRYMKKRNMLEVNDKDKKVDKSELHESDTILA